MNREQILSVLCDLAFTVGGEVSEATLLTRTLQRFMYHTGFPVGLLLSHAAPEPGRRVDGRLEMAIGDYSLGRRRGGPFSIPGALVPSDPVLVEDRALLGEIPTRKPMAAVLSLPIEGFGHILLLSPRPPETELPLTEAFLPVLSRLATAIRLCQTYERDVQSRIKHGAHFDPLTGLPNATRFSIDVAEAVAAARRSGRPLAVGYMDLDDFGRVNERLGRDGGDALLVALARRLQQLALPGEVFAHLPGDEFALLLSDAADRQEAEDRIATLQERLQAPLSASGQYAELSASIGIALFPDDAADAELLLRHAQMAMVDAKQTGRGSRRFFNAEQNRLAHERRTLLARLALALKRDELRLHYQPKVEMGTGRVIGAEALLRWQDPENGLRSPVEFLPSIETSDLIVEIGEWALREALRQWARWRALGLDVPISVNIATRHLQEPDFVARFHAALASVPESSPLGIEIEILESSAIRDLAHARAVMLACREMGIGIALDDFGTGYSSLAYLSQLPATTLKIDQLFVRELFDAASEPAIVRAIIEIARVFECAVVAEGVESVEHGLVLSSMGCRFVQGFVVSRALPAADFPSWVASFRPPDEWVRYDGRPWSRDLHELLKGTRGQALLIS